MQRPQGLPAHESTCLKFSPWFRGELGESVVVRWDQNPALCHQLHSLCLEEEKCCLWPQEHHPHHQTWRWKHYTLGCFLLRGQNNCTASAGRWTGPCTVRTRALNMGRGWVLQPYLSTHLFFPGVSRISHTSPAPLLFCYFSWETPVICMAQI